MTRQAAHASCTVGPTATGSGLLHLIKSQRHPLSIQAIHSLQKAIDVGEPHEATRRISSLCEKFDCALSLSK